MVADVDLVVTIAGRRHTEVVIEQALEQGLPVLPIPDAGGDSRVLLEKYRERIALGFAPGALDRCLQQVSKSIQADPKEAAAAVVNLMRTAKVGKCLMLLPYDLEHNTLYESVLRTSVAKHMLPIRLDELPSSEAISANFADAIRSSLAVVADVTVRNENVVYEVGYAHGHGLKPLIYTRDPSRLAQLPVYFRALNIRVVSSETQINCAIEEYLLAVKAARRVR